MDLFILKADGPQEINKISEELSLQKFKKIQEEKHFILMKKNRYGNYYVHILFLFIGLFFFYFALIVNVVYFTYSYLWASPHVLITDETKSQRVKIWSSIRWMKLWKRQTNCFSLFFKITSGIVLHTMVVMSLK